MAKIKSANTEYAEWCQQEVDGRFRGERWPAGACCDQCGRRPTLVGSALCERCMVGTPGSGWLCCQHCGYPLGESTGKCNNDACPQRIRAIYVRVILMVLAAALISWVLCTLHTWETKTWTWGTP